MEDPTARIAEYAALATERLDHTTPTTNEITTAAVYAQLATATALGAHAEAIAELAYQLGAGSLPTGITLTPPTRNST
ncbi:hypothetical protein [Streptomyces sp. NPDC058657]|uniref:hypothetical protein n=1 Tax=unclassified Streptomyces TaxID=2593676 RepID=UPI003661FC6E